MNCSFLLIVSRAPRTLSATSEDPRCSTQLASSRPDKDALRSMLEAQVEEKLQSNPDAVTTYAAKPEPERKRYTTKPSVQDKAFIKELEQMRADAEAGVFHRPVPEQTNNEAGIRLDDYPGLREVGNPSNYR